MSFENHICSVEDFMQLAKRLPAFFMSFALFCVSRSAAFADPKDMFYQELKGENPSGAVSVAYCLELHRGDSPPTLCNNRFAFSSGDGIRLHVKTTAPSYAYIGVLGSSGSKSIIYPPSPNEDNKVEPGKEVLVPPKGMIVFDDKPGTERVVVILSPQPLDITRDLNMNSAAAIGGDTLSGLPVKVGGYEVMSNDGFYDLGEKAPGSGLVFVTNPDPSKPTVIALALQHEGRGGQQPSAAPSQPSQPSPSAAPPQSVQNGPAIKVQYNIAAVHNDGQQELRPESEVYSAFHQVPQLRKSGIDCGSRDQYVAGLNHLYVNFFDQQIPFHGNRVYYTQEAGNPRMDDTGERLRTPSWRGGALPSDRTPDSSPGPTARFDGIACIEECLSGGKPNLVGGATLRRLWQDPKILVVSNGADLDRVWEANGGTPVIMGVDCRAKMFGAHSDHFAGHVVVLSERRDMAQGSGATSNHEYRLLNSWGTDNSGRVRNGWVSADAAASAMNYTDPANDASVEPHRAFAPDALPLPSENDYAGGDDGLKGDDDPTRDLEIPISMPDFSRALNLQLDKPSAGTRGFFKSSRGSKEGKGDADDIRKHVNDSKEGFTPEEKSIIDRAISNIMANKTDKGTRPYPLSEDQKAGIFQQANRLFTESSKIYAQGLDQGDRNRALIALLHDNANPENINQGAHNTCNVTTIMKVETMARPVAQVKRFVDMYTNANGDQTVSMP
ncbi:MAG TPA: DUF4384 domain-containing protein [Oculatellaceae cyanobacterium]